MAAAPEHQPLPPLPPQHQDQNHQGQFYQYQYQQPQTQPQYQHQQPAPQSRPRPQPSQSHQSRSRAFSFHSEGSRKSVGNRKIDLHETSAEKEAHRLHSKADPTLAMNEAEPSAVQATEKASLAPLRSMQHKDPFGNPINDPDRSNPTRSRWERPLDTIRSFEAAIDGAYSRKSYTQSEAEARANWDRRSSYYGSKQQHPMHPMHPMHRTPSAASKMRLENGPRFPQESYYGGSRPPSQYGMMSPPARDGTYDGHYGGGNAHGGYGPPGPGRHRASRMQSEPQLNHYARGDPSVYPLQHKDRSYETVTSAAASGSSGDQGSYQTDPSSDNSSVDRNSPAKRPLPPMNDYGIGFSQTPAYQPPAFTLGTNMPPTKKPVAQGYRQGPPPVPQKDQDGVVRRPAAPQRPEPEKRKSWFARRFSKAG